MTQKPSIRAHTEPCIAVTGKDLQMMGREIAVQAHGVREIATGKGTDYEFDVMNTALRNGAELADWLHEQGFMAGTRLVIVMEGVPGSFVGVFNGTFTDWIVWDRPDTVAILGQVHQTEVGNNRIV